MDSVSLENVVVFLIEKSQFFWGTITENEIYIEIFDTSTGSTKTHLTFGFNYETCEWLCQKTSQIKDLQEFFEDFEEIEWDYYDNSLPLNPFGNVRMTFSVFLNFVCMYLIKKNDQSLNTIMCYSPEVNKNDITVTVSGGKTNDQSTVSYDVENFQFLTDEPSSAFTEFYTYIKAMTHSLLSDACQLDYL